MCYCTVFSLLCFEFEDNFRVQAPGGLYFGGRFIGGFFCVTSLAGAGLYLEGHIFGTLRYMKRIKPPPPNQGWENGAFWPSCGFILDFGRMGDLLFHFILSKIKIITGGHQFENYHPRADGSKCHHLNMINISLYYVRGVKLNATVAPVLAAWIFWESVTSRHS